MNELREWLDEALAEFREESPGAEVRDQFVTFLMIKRSKERAAPATQEENQKTAERAFRKRLGLDNG